VRLHCNLNTEAFVGFNQMSGFHDISFYTAIYATTVLFHLAKNKEFCKSGWRE
jgi:hypothetical protein